MTFLNLYIEVCCRTVGIIDEQIAKVRILNEKYKNHHVLGPNQYVHGTMTSLTPLQSEGGNKSIILADNIDQIAG